VYARGIRVHAVAAGGVGSVERDDWGADEGVVVEVVEVVEAEVELVVDAAFVEDVGGIVAYVEDVGDAADADVGGRAAEEAEVDAAFVSVEGENCDEVNEVAVVAAYTVAEVARIVAVLVAVESAAVAVEFAVAVAEFVVGGNCVGLKG
jgi:hypothetical protein